MMPNGSTFTATADYAAVQTNAVLKAAPANGMRLYITNVIVSNGATAGQIKFVENTASPTDVIENLHLGVNGGATLEFGRGLPLSKEVNFGVTSTTADDFSVTILGYEAF